MVKNISYKPKTQLAINLINSIGNANNFLQEKLHSYVKTTGLTPSQFAIIIILGNNGALKISDIYKQMLIKSGNRTMILDSLEKRNFINRIFSKNDRREIIIELTAAGQKFFEENHEKYSNFVEKIISNISQNEQKDIATIAKKIIGEN
ncbi:MAG: hypothetical protein COW71_07205 [Ignavibacteriales bacterium CG18_big_fil_WC_8_21_14_2_50_31_20]|nr:MAG: hypothetical protein COW71_07205 [Ignavibacteriales bacterium CG18_big_fil_WC_8_21_14_2_50_31_20]